MEREGQYGADQPFVNLVFHNPIHRLWMFDQRHCTSPATAGDNFCGQSEGRSSSDREMPP